MNLPEHELERLHQLHSLQILDTPADPAFDSLTALAAELLEVPVALISLVDRDRQWFKSRIGLEVCETARDISFCQHTLHDGQPLLVEDASSDPRFAANPLVTGAPHVRFYAGIPLKPDGRHVLGTLCVVDTRPRRLDASRLRQLTALAGQAEELLKLQRQRRLLDAESLRSRQQAARYEAISRGAAAGIVRIDRHGRILEINDFALNLLGHAREELLGENVRRLMPEHWASQHDRYLADYLDSGTPRIIGTGRRVEALHREGHVIPVHLAVSEVRYGEGDETRDFVGILSDLREVHSANALLERQQHLLGVLHRGLTDYQALMSGNRLWAFLKHALRELTGSQCALIGEVLPHHGRPALKIHAITDMAWDDASRTLLGQLRSGELLLDNPDTMLGQVFAGGQVVCSNNMPDDPRYRHCPAGHPVLCNYLGVPIVDQGEVIGMYAIANSELRLDEALAEWLEPFTSTCALLIRLYRQLEERESITEQLRRARDEAEEASRAKTEFLSSMSHELRTPLNAILGFAQLLRSSQKHPLNERQQRQVEQIYKSGNHLLTLINEVLDLARIEAGHINLSLESIRLADVLDDACTTLAPIAAQHGIRVLPPPRAQADLWLLADYTRLKQVLINLLTNAVKYNRADGSVRIDCRSAADSVRVRICDTGQGIPAEKLGQLFQPFNRLGAENGRIEGTGVGLALTKKILEKMQGRIGVSSQPGVGSEFWFELPLAERQDAAAELPPAAPPLAESAAAGRFRVLYIEDNPANQRLLQELFEDLDGFTLHCAHSAELGLELAGSLAPDLILLDINLPGMNGYQAMAILARNPLTRQIPVVALSANAMPDDLRQAKAAGFTDYLTKPLDIARLLAVLDECAARETLP